MSLSAPGMSLPAPGNYYIVNTVPDVDSNPLAINFTGEYNPLSVVPLAASERTQVWNIEDRGGETYVVSPKDYPALQVIYADGFLTTFFDDGSTWNISRDGDSYIFRYFTYPWYIKTAKPEEKVTLNPVRDPVVPTEFWYLHPAN